MGNFYFNYKKTVWSMIVIFVFLIVSEFFIYRKTYFPDYPIDSLFGIYGLLGFLSTFIFILLAKFLCFLVQREESSND